MMSTNFSSGALVAGVIFHVLFCLVALVGLVFLMVWLVRSLSVQKLKNWGIGLFVGGLIGSALLGAAVHMHGGMGMPRMMERGDRNSEMMKGEKMGMMKSEKNEMMEQEDMAGMLMGKTGDEFDMAFLKQMIAHHQGAIDMANAALKSAKHEEIKDMAADIIATQQKEIDQMQQWEKTWSSTK